MARVSPRGLYIWDLETDKFDHVKLAANWDLIDQLLGSPPQSLETLAALPTSGNFPGRVIMLSAADSGFLAWTILRFDGSSWRVIGPQEVLPATPQTNNYPGRMVVLSADDPPFNAWTTVIWDGSGWNSITGWERVNTSDGISGVATHGDAYLTDALRGLVLVDRVTGVRRRIYLKNGGLYTEALPVLLDPIDPQPSPPPGQPGGPPTAAPPYGPPWPRQRTGGWVFGGGA